MCSAEYFYLPGRTLSTIPISDFNILSWRRHYSRTEIPAKEKHFYSSFSLSSGYVSVWKFLDKATEGNSSSKPPGQHGETSRLNSALWASQTCLAMWCQRLESAPAIPPSSSCHPTRHRYALAQTSVFARYNFSFSQEKKSFSIFFGDIKLHAKTEQACFFFLANSYG